MKRVRLAAASLVIALGGAGCSHAATSARAGEHNPWTIPGELRIGMSEEPDSLNPFFSHSASSDVIAGLVYSFLLRYDATGNYVPDLATAASQATDNGGISPDGKTIVIHLRKDARWVRWKRC